MPSYGIARITQLGPSVCPEFGEFDKIAVFNHFAFIEVGFPPAMFTKMKDFLSFQKSPHKFICK